MTPAQTQPRIQSLPPEILSTIFILTNVKPFKTRFEERFYRKPYGDQLKLNGSLVGSVCRCWRALSLNTPALWSKIILDLSQLQYPPTILERLQMHFERSKSLPISVSLDFHRNFDFDSCLEFLESSQLEGDASFRLLKTIFDHAGRIQQLTLSGAREEFFTVLMPTFRDQFSNINRLALYNNTMTATNGLSTFSDARIQSIELRGVKLTSEHCIPCSHLTSIIIDDIDLTLLIRVLAANSSSLQHADVFVCDFSIPDNIPIPTLPNLHTLNITAKETPRSPFTFFYHSSSANFLHQFACPALDTFSFQDVYELSKQSTFVHALASFLARSPHLRYLRLGGTLFKEEELFMLIDGIPTLSILDLFYSGTTRFMDDLATHISGLKDLRIHTADKKFDWDTFRGMVTALWEGQEPPRLQSVYLSTYRVSVPDDIIVWVRDMQIEGRAIRIYIDRDGHYEFFKYRLPGMPYEVVGWEEAEIWDSDRWT
ncbi:hypothetical protein VNI00_010832 [Paramarasmius palmivorus]|uniref:F-box domain-containing protein n=1 Tax=Paramarasmius palmivorus TaxID=297713 RepID=A0AAW0CC72_9AGAR